MSNVETNGLEGFVGAIGGDDIARIKDVRDAVLITADYLEECGDDARAKFFRDKAESLENTEEQYLEQAKAWAQMLLSPAGSGLAFQFSEAAIGLPTTSGIYFGTEHRVGSRFRPFDTWDLYADPVDLMDESGERLLATYNNAVMAINAQKDGECFENEAALNRRGMKGRIRAGGLS